MLRTLLYGLCGQLARVCGAAAVRYNTRLDSAPKEAVMAKKYKFKPNKGLLKRVKISGRGKVKFKRAGGTHLMSGTTGNQKRKLRKRGLVKAGDIRRIGRMLQMRLIPGDRKRPEPVATEAAAE
jgi:large subunit ribosomal protein L35